MVCWIIGGVEGLPAPGLPAITARQNRHPMRLCMEIARDVFDHRRLARPAKCNITYSDDGRSKLLRRAVMGFVSGNAQSHCHLVEPGRQPGQGAREFFIFADHSKCSRIKATVHLVAPRFSSKISRARAPMACAVLWSAS